MLTLHAYRLFHGDRTFSARSGFAVLARAFRFLALITFDYALLLAVLRGLGVGVPYPLALFFSAGMFYVVARTLARFADPAKRSRRQQSEPAS